MKSSSTSITSNLIAPCGMNCRLCRAFGREKDPCPGCRDYRPGTFKSIDACRIRKCKLCMKGKASFCFECSEFPCARVKHLDKRYRTKYSMSMIENLVYLRENGIRKFVAREKVRWACSKCGEILCVHKEACEYCGHKWR